MLRLMTSSVASNREEAMIEPAVDIAIDIVTSFSNLMNSAVLIKDVNSFIVLLFMLCTCHVDSTYYTFSVHLMYHFLFNNYKIEFYILL